jgi:glucokinase
MLAGGRGSRVESRIAKGEELTAKMLAEEAEAGDEFSLEVILDTARYLGVGVTNVVHTVDPGMVVIGGAMTFGRNETNVGRKFLAELQAEFQRRAFNVVSGTVINYAALGSDAGFFGAAGIGRAGWKKRPT